MTARRVLDEPAYVLHRYDWSESSLILEVFTRHHGRLALAAKGVKRPSSSFRPVLLPLQPLHIAYGGDGEIRTLKAAHWQGGHVMPTGAALLAGTHLNELLLALLAREDAHPVLFDIYGETVAMLATQATRRHAGVRAFELLLLREVGLLPVLDCQTLTLQPLHPSERYALVPEGGLRLARDAQEPALPGQDWLQLQQALDIAGASSWGEVLMACETCVARDEQALLEQLRSLLHYHCGVRTLRTRQLLSELQDL